MAFKFYSFVARKYYVTPGNLTNVRVRIVNGGMFSVVQGRVEVYYSGVWGTVCDNGWDIEDAHVVCRMLGFSRALQAVRSANFGKGTGLVLLENVGCRGNEKTLVNCSHNGWGKNNCDHYEDAGVVCSSGNNTSGIIVIVIYNRKYE